MAILLKRAIEPGSRQSETIPSILAGSRVQERLRTILKRYVEGSVTGRSFLISGHRGAGKTTLVKRVVQEVAKDVEKQPLRPLLVSLSGPMLLPPTGKTPGGDETEAVLKQLTLNLYRTLARHFAERYTDLVEKLSPLWKSDPHKAACAMEMAADFRQKLDGHVELAELRAFWDYTLCLESGILFQPPRGQQPGQGSKEIIALWSCLRAYLSLAAESYDEKMAASDSGSRKAQTSASTPTDKGILSALLGLGSGGVVGAGLIAAKQSSPIAIISALAAAVGTTFLLNFSTSRNQEAAIAKESTIKIKRDMQSLARELPELLQRCRDAGIVPVFLIDELDKVKDLETRMQSLIYSTKLLVTEQSVFFFVTDRSYYEYIEKLCRETAYPREHTFFSERLFVSYQPKDWRTYISEILTPESTQADLQEQEKKAIDILTFVLMCRSRLHAIDLRRAIGSIAEVPATEVREDVESVVNLKADDLTKQRRYLFEILVQVAVEVTLAADADFSGRCLLEPPFTQVAYDALYYLPRKWESEPRIPFALEINEFREWLDKRSEDVVMEEKEGSPYTGNEEYEEHKEKAVISDEEKDRDTSFLLRKVESVLFWLQNPRQLATEPLTKEKFLPAVIEMVEATPALVRQNAEDKFEWLYDSYGRALHPEPVERVRDNPGLAHDRQMVREISDAVKDLTTEKFGLGAIQKAGLISAIPPVTAVFDALERLQNLETHTVSYPQMDEDAQNVTIFAATLRERSEAIARAIVAAWILARCSQSKDDGSRFLAGWSALANRITSKASNADQTCNYTRDIFYHLQGRYTDKENPYLKIVDLRRFSTKEWGDSLRVARDRILAETVEEKTSWQEIEADAWAGWAETAVRFLQNVMFEYGRITEHLVSELLIAARGDSPARLLNPDLSTVSLAIWSELMALEILSKSPNLPSWITPVAILASGLSAAENAAIFDRIAKDNQVPADLRQEVRNRAAAQPTASQKKVIIVRAVESSICMQWLPDPEYRCVVFTREEITNLGKESEVNLSTAEFILIELEEKESADSFNVSQITELPKLLPFLSRFALTSVTVAFLTSKIVAKSASSILSVISAPVSVRDAVTRSLVTSGPTLPTPSPVA